MKSRLSSIASSLPFAHLLGVSPDSKQERNADAEAGNHPSTSKRRTDALTAAAERLDAAALAQATSAAVAAERVRWSEIMAVGLSVGMAAYATHLAQSDVTAHEAIATLKTARTNKDRITPQPPVESDGWLAEKARQAAEGRPTPMQLHAERIRKITAQGLAE